MSSPVNETSPTVTPLPPPQGELNSPAFLFGTAPQPHIEFRFNATTGSIRSGVFDVYPPFDISNQDLDIVLRSSDGVNFHFMKIFLSIASPVFKDMFSLAQPILTLAPCHATLLDESRDGRPVVKVTESRVVLGNLLTYCYPRWVPNTPLGQLRHIGRVLEAARKYQMDSVLQVVGQTLVTPRFLEEDPFQVFIIACQYELGVEAAIAAEHTLKSPLSSRSYIPDLERITGGMLQRLLDYHFRCGRVAQNLTKLPNLRWITQDDYHWFRHECVSCCLGSTSVTISGHRVQTAAGYWVKYMEDIGNALAESPCVATVMNQELMDSAIKQARACPACLGDQWWSVAQDFEVFRASFAKEVEEVLLPSHTSFISEMRHTLGL